MANSTAELLERARKIHDLLKADEAFLHANEESHGIIVPNLGDSFIGLAQSLLSPEDFVPSEVMRRTASVVAAASRDLNASYIRTKGGSGSVDIDIRGDAGPVDFESLDLNGLAKIEMRQSGINISFTPDRVILDVHTEFMTIGDGRDAEDLIRPLMRTLSAEQTAAIAAGLLGIVENEVLRVVNS